MQRNFNPFPEIDLIAQIADLKEVDYKNTLVISALVELLAEKGWITRSELLNKVKQLEVDLTLELAANIHASQSTDLN